MIAIGVELLYIDHIDSVTQRVRMKAYNVKPRLNIGNILVIGEAQHGKDTLMDYLEEKYGVQGWSSSWFAANRFMVEEFAKEGKHYSDPADCYADRGAHRDFWFDRIEEFNTPDKAKMAKLILMERPVYNGMSSYKEFLAAQKEELFDIIIYVDAKARLEKEGTYKPDTTLKIPKSEAHIVIENNGTKEQFFSKIDGLMKAMGISELIKMEYIADSDDEIVVRSSCTSFVNVSCKEVRELPVDHIVMHRKALIKKAREAGVKVKRSLQDVDVERLVADAKGARELYLANFQTLRQNWQNKLKTGVRKGYSDDLEIEFLGDLKNRMDAMLRRSQPLSLLLDIHEGLIRVDEMLDSGDLTSVTI